jgi:voltage-gated potassium channel
MWWAMATLTTVGYGDVYPITPVGKVMAGVVAICGIGIIAMPAGIIAANFGYEYIKNTDEEDKS